MFFSISAKNTQFFDDDATTHFFVDVPTHKCEENVQKTLNQINKAITISAQKMRKKLIKAKKIAKNV